MLFWNEKELDKSTMKNGPQMLHALLKVKQIEEDDQIYGKLGHREIEMELMLSQTIFLVRLGALSHLLQSFGRILQL